MKPQLGPNAFLLAQRYATYGYIDEINQIIILWDGKTAGAFRKGYLLGEYLVDEGINPTMAELEQAIRRICRNHPLPNVPKER